MMQGCSGGSCVAAKTFPTPATCAGGGPNISLDPGMGAVAQCAGKLAQTTFTWSICSCKNVNFEDATLIDGWDSTKGTYKAGQLGGGVGADGSITAMSGAQIWGQAWAAAKGTAFNISGLTVHDDLQSGGNVVGEGSVTHNAYVVGNIDGNLQVGKMLYQKGVTVNPPCDCSTPIPVGALVAAAKTTNDNMAIGLDPGFMTGNHPPRIDLPCGRYYLTGFSATGSIVAHGHVALFVDGNIGSSGDLTITVADSSSSFDIFVSGTIGTQANFKLGNPNFPALTRLYVGGTQALNIQSGLIVGAEIWAGNATVTWESTSDMFGAIFAGDFNALSALRLHHDQGVVRAGEGCPPPPGAPPGPGGAGGAGGSGGGGSMCGTCKDCGNQACVNATCGQCTSDAQCCAPLVCVNGGCAALEIVR
jgi:hypothetical protein